MSSIINVVVDGIECPFCLQQFFSRHRHDMRYCGCGYCFVDGGIEYLRYGWGLGEGHLANMAGPPRMVQIRAYKREYTEEEQIAYRQAQMISIRSLRDSCKLPLK